MSPLPAEPWLGCGDGDPGLASSSLEAPLVALLRLRSSGEPSSALAAPCARAQANAWLGGCKGWRPSVSVRVWLLTQAAQSPRGEVSQRMETLAAALCRCAPGSKGWAKPCKSISSHPQEKAGAELGSWGCSPSTGRFFLLQ